MYNFNQKVVKFYHLRTDQRKRARGKGQEI